ncbi:MAG: L,D-transpeptidase family protein [Ferruginibacter sp.]
MKKLLGFFIISLLVLSVFSNCNSKASEPVITRDTTITPVNAITTLLIDSAFVDSFLISKNIPDSTKKRIRDFYVSRNFQYAWFNEDGIAEQTKTFWNLQNYYLRLNRDSSLYNKDLNDRMEYFMHDTTFSITEKDVPLTELQLTRHFFQYAQYAYAGKIDPAELQWHIPRKKLNPLALLDSLIKNKGNNLKEWEPVNGSYLKLQEKLIVYYDIAKKGGWDSLKISPSLKFSNKDSSLLKLKERLVNEGDITETDSSIIFDSTLLKGINNAKIRYGITPDGKINNVLINALNVTVENRIEQILLNMERMRWLPGTNTSNILVANIPDFTLRVFENNEVVLKMNIVVGKEGTSSVIFSDILKYVVFAPYWNVPQSIVKNEILPGMNRNKRYLARHNMEVTCTRNGYPVVRQKPGEVTLLD